MIYIRHHDIIEALDALNDCDDLVKVWIGHDALAFTAQADTVRRTVFAAAHLDGEEPQHYLVSAHELRVAVNEGRWDAAMVRVRTPDDYDTPLMVSRAGSDVWHAVAYRRTPMEAPLWAAARAGTTQSLALGPASQYAAVLATIDASAGWCLYGEADSTVVSVADASGRHRVRMLLAHGRVERPFDLRMPPMDLGETLADALGQAVQPLRVQLVTLLDAESHEIEGVGRAMFSYGSETCTVPTADAFAAPDSDGASRVYDGYDNPPRMISVPVEALSAALAKRGDARRVAVSYSGGQLRLSTEPDRDRTWEVPSGEMMPGEWGLAVDADALAEAVGHGRGTVVLAVVPGQDNLLVNYTDGETDVSLQALLPTTPLNG